jgi:phosphoglycerol transferase
MERYKGNVDTLKVVDNDIRYKADSFVFNVAGAPEEVKAVQRHFASRVLGSVVQCPAGQRRED